MDFLRHSIKLTWRNKDLHIVNLTLKKRWGVWSTGLRTHFFFNYLLLFSRSVIFDSLWPHGLWHSRLPCLSLFPRVCSNSCPLSQWCHPTSSSSSVPFSFYPQSFSASGSFPVSQLLIPGGQSIEVSASTSVLPVNIRVDFS